MSKVLSVTALLALGLSAPALAHPFGAPLRAVVEGAGSDVLVRWSADEDDWIALARHTGAFDEAAAGPAGGQRSGAERITDSERVVRYLLANVTVAQDGVTCPGEVVGFGDLVTEGTLVRLRCPEQVDTVEIGIMVLTDVHEAYRTVATAPGGVPGRALYTSTNDVHRWDLAATAPAAATAGARARAGMAILALVMTAGVMLARAWRRSGGATTPPTGDCRRRFGPGHDPEPRSPRQVTAVPERSAP